MQSISITGKNRELEQFYRQFAFNYPGGIALVRTNGENFYEIMDVNPAAEQISGRAKASLIHKDVDLLFQPCYIHDLYHLIAKSHEENSPQKVTLLFKEDNNEKLPKRKYVRKVEIFPLKDGILALLFNDVPSSTRTIEGIDRIFERPDRIVLIYNAEYDIVYQNDFASELKELVKACPIHNDIKQLLQKLPKGGPGIMAEPVEFPVSNRLIRFTTMSLDGGGLSYVEAEDITSLREVQDRLSLQEEIVKTISEGVALIRAEDNIIIFSNPVFNRMHGYEADEIIGQTFDTFCEEGEFIPKTTSKIIQARVTKKNDLHGKIISKRKDGSRFMSYYNISFLAHREYGELYLTALTDMSNSKTSEHSIQKSEPDSSHVGVFSWNRRANMLYVSDEIRIVLGLEQERKKVTFRHMLKKIHPADRHLAARSFAKAVYDKKDIHKKFRILSEGIEKYVQVNAQYLGKGPSAELLGTVQDVTMIQNKFRQTFRLVQVFNNSNEGVVVTNSENKIIEVNPAFEKITGFKGFEVMGKDPGFLKSGRHNKNFYKKMWQDIIETGHWEGEIWDRKRSGEIYPKYLSINTMIDEFTNEVNYVGIFSDITQKKRNEEELKYLAYYDALTGLPNRYQFVEKLEYSIKYHKRYGKKIAIIFIGINDFKSINDRLGHAAGDSIMSNISEFLRISVRKNDFVARLGGDEFAVTLTEINSVDEIHTHIKHILSSISRKYNWSTESVFINASAGVSIFPDNDIELSELLRKCDTALHHAKKDSQKNYALYESLMEEEVRKKYFLRANIYKALENKEFEIYYQPQVDANTYRIIGMESLIRWNSPIRGFISPAEFIPFAEENDLIVHISNFVLETVCRQNKTWQDTFDYFIPISVNLSVRHFQKSDVIRDVQKALESSGLAAEYLKVEITEGHLMQEIERAILTLNCLKRIGVRSSIDDFGTGYSSLNYLHRFPIDELKIDRSFISNIDTEETIARAIISLASSLNLKVIAEGVEKENQVKKLLEMGCRYIQGFYFSPALPCREVEKYFSGFSKNPS